MVLLLVVGFNNDRCNVLLAQALLLDENFESHVWMFTQLTKSTGNDYQAFLTAFYSCRNCIVENVFEQWFNNLLQNYPNAKTYLEFIYKTKMYWAHCYTKFKFTGGMIASSRVESVNGCLKRLLHNSNIPLCDLIAEIQRLLDLQDKENEYNFWRLSIPTIRHQKNSNFLFSKIDQILQHYLTPTMLKMHRNEMN
ncbi:protein FAR1-RELATED SEQUENCE 5-like [Rhizophagus irregularis DAOM 181602=DAOM 197198]|uniref:MULE transposase domain-containing protein n=1 Tax=Rhizophagus irregularis (strain DAOM 197198w) TaxID=1432141 RepID=A0A015JG13_RHIIW|nr:hypothetical protein RirG_239850 [Rhizophagus irregularis DAOM 197198w]GET52286.1 protein FAR1-RELATED SEQUENCE 5-like [Rhizophagus irregularis DAOM 181602=DAOM 197198]